MNINYFLLIVFLSVVLIGVQFSDAQRQHQPSDEEIDKLVEMTIQDYLETILFQDPTVQKDNVKIASGLLGALDVQMVHEKVRIIYASNIDDKIIYNDELFLVDFNFQPTNSTAKLEKIFEMEYLPPKKIRSYLDDNEWEKYVTISYGFIMCKPGFEKVIKQSNDEAKCVKLESVEKLIERGFLKNKN